MSERRFPDPAGALAVIERELAAARREMQAGRLEEAAAHAAFARGISHEFEAACREVRARQVAANR